MPAAAPRSKRARPAALEGRVWTLALPSLGKIRGIAVATDGTIFVSTKSALFIITLTGRMTLLAGSRRETGYKDGQGDKARFNWPTGLAVMADGSVLVADYHNHRLRQVSLDGTVTTVAGSGQAGHSDGAGTAARFRRGRLAPGEPTSRLWDDVLATLPGGDECAICQSPLRPKEAHRDGGSP